MKKRSKHKSVVTAPRDEPGVADTINKMQQQLSAMEKKLDILIGQSSKKPFEKSYSQRPPRPFERSPRHDREKQGNGFRERTFTRVVCSDCSKECEIPFKPSGGRPVYCKECFSKRRKDNPFNANRDNRPEERDLSREHRFDKRQSKKRQKPDTEKKPFYARIKKRR